MLGIAAVARVTGKESPVAEILPSRRAIDADATRPAEPRNADPLPFDEVARRLHDVADDLMADDQRQLRIGQLAVDDMQIRTADRTDVDVQEQLALTRLRHGYVREHERLALLFQEHGLHRCPLSVGCCP